MSQQVIHQTEEPGYKSRVRFEIPDFDYFAELLHDRLHAILYHYEDWNSKFMLITNLYDRDPKRIQERREKTPDDIEALIHTGTERQRIILEKDDPLELLIKENNWDRTTWRHERDQNWNALSWAIFNRNMPNVATFPYFDAFRKGDLKMEDVKVGFLKDYFRELDNNFKQNEYPIYSDYFDIKNDIYIGFPLLGMGLFQGMVWILCKKEEEVRFNTPTIKRIIKYFQVEYENLVLDWDVKGENIRKLSLVGNVFDELEENNDIQKAINIRKYYRNSEHYHRERISQSDEVVKQLRLQYSKTAIINTLLDSYAHNISAHSLTALSWWFRERAEFLDETHGGRRVIEQMGRDTNPLIVHYLKTKEIAGDKERVALSRDLAPLFKFLQEKGAFWSGITRQTNMTGKISSLFSILWYDFVNNPLYLGTIANTEQVRKLHLNITIFDHEEDHPDKPFRNTKIIKKNPDGVLLDGTFATINLDDFDLNKHEPKSSVFVEKGELYEHLADELRRLKAFFPGGVVGKHAFFTLLENEVRNVKHFRGERLRAIQKDGLTLNLSVHTRPVDSTKPTENSQYEILKIGVWLKHLVSVDSGLLLSRIENLDKDILEEDTLQPRLGGNQQDKLCASMLLNKTFDKVQDRDSPLGEIYFPWLKTATADYHDHGDRVEEFEVSRRKYINTSKEDFQAAFEEVKGDGYLKKYFHMWKADDIVAVDRPLAFNDVQLENHSRFRFLHLSGEALLQKTELQRQGIMRIITGLTPPQSVAEAYGQWLSQWTKDKEKDTVIDFFVNDKANNAARITLVNGKITFFNKAQIKQIFREGGETERAYLSIPNRMTITVEHGSQLTSNANKFNIRSQGELVRTFGQGRFPDEMKEMDEAAAAELLEALSTRIALFDRRIYNRLVAPASDKMEEQLARLGLYDKDLRLSIRNESATQWKALLEKGFVDNFHFVVVHLSFIEGIKDEKGEKYSEARILEFINDWVLAGRRPEETGDNFKLVITTGRGRMKWWDTIQESPAYARFVTFRPIESILGAVEDAMQMPDDVDMKYNLAKLLFGS